MPQSDPTPTPEGPHKRPSDRDLIRAAINQGAPREGSVDFAGDLPADGTFPGYELLREIHRGGQGVVYQAIQKTTKRKVALKVLHGGPFSGTTGRSRFEREVQVLGQLNHPNIVRIHDSGATPDGSFFYVMDYISGRSLDELIEDKRPGVDDTLRLFTKICDAVNAAHLKGVIHRDLKPANVRVDANGEPIVVDFGLAKIAGPDVIDDGTDAHTPQLMTVTGQFIGSLPWASPEQAEGVPGNIDVRTDVYSLGVILYQMLTGQFPYKVVGNMRDVLDNILKAVPARPSTVRRQINDEVETIVLKCLTKDRDRRYQTAGELARDIRHYLAGEPIEAKRDSAVYVLGKALHRYRAAAAAAAAFLVLLIAFSIAMTVMYKKTRAAEVAATDALGREREATGVATAQALRAERNFKAGHDLAMVMLTEIEDALHDLRGATAARETVLKQAQQYLAKLETEAGDDPSLLLDLARAHERVGDLQGELYMRKTGETASAEKHFARSREIRDALLVRLPDDPRVNAAIARSLYREAGLLVQRRELPTARDRFVASLAAYDTALRLAANRPEHAARIPKWNDDRAWTIRALGDALYYLGDTASMNGDAAASRQLLLESEERLKEAERIWRARLAAAPSDADAARALGVLADRRSAALVVSAKTLFNSAKKLKTAGQPEEAAAQTQAAYARLADARAAALAAADGFQKLAAADNASGQLRRDLWLSYLSAGITHAEAATILKEMSPGTPDEATEHTSALNYFRQAETIARRLGDEDVRSLEARRDLALCVNRVGGELRALQMWAEAEAAYAESARLREQLNEADPIQMHQRDLGLGYFKQGQLNKEWAATLGPPERNQKLADAHDQLTRALALFEQLRAAGALAPENPYTTEARAALAEVEAARPPS